MFVSLKALYLSQILPSFVLGTKVNTNQSVDKILGGIVDFICQVGQYVGAVVLVSGIFMFILAYKDDNAESQSRAIRFAIVGAVLMSLKVMLKTVGVIS